MTREHAPIRGDIADLIRLIRFVEGRRASLVGDGAATKDADDVLNKLRRELRIILGYRRQSAAPRSSAAA